MHAKMQPSWVSGRIDVHALTSPHLVPTQLPRFFFAFNVSLEQYLVMSVVAKTRWQNKVKASSKIEYLVSNKQDQFSARFLILWQKLFEVHTSPGNVSKYKPISVCIQMIYRLGRIEIALEELFHFSYSYFANRFFLIFGSCIKKMFQSLCMKGEDFKLF